MGIIILEKHTQNLSNASTPRVNGCVKQDDCSLTFWLKVFSDDVTVLFRLDKIVERVTNHIARTEGHKGLHVVTGVQDHTITVNDHQEPIHCLRREREGEGGGGIWVKGKKQVKADRLPGVLSLLE